jgi:hypothetical protein
LLPTQIGHFTQSSSYLRQEDARIGRKSVNLSRRARRVAVSDRVAVDQNGLAMIGSLRDRLSSMSRARSSRSWSRFQLLGFHLEHPTPQNAASSNIAATICRLVE